MSLTPEELAQLNTLIYQPGFKNAFEDDNNKDINNLAALLDRMLSKNAAANTIAGVGLLLLAFVLFADDLSGVGAADDPAAIAAGAEAFALLFGVPCEQTLPRQHERKTYD